MPRSVTSSTVSAHVARNQLGSLLREVGRKKIRFIITKGGKPTAVLLGIEDFDDMLEELDPEFQGSLKAAAKEYRAGKSVTLAAYVKERPAVRRAG